MKHPHHDMIVEWAADTSRVVQWFSTIGNCWHDCRAAPEWNQPTQYRFKPEPKPDVSFDLIVRQVDAYPEIHYPEHWELANIRFTFDGDTGKLKQVVLL